MPFPTILAPLAKAPLGGLVVFAVFSAVTLITAGPIMMPEPPGARITTFAAELLFISVSAYAAAGILVLPFLLAVPALRQPPLWAATISGAFVAVLVVLVTMYVPIWYGLSELRVAAAATEVVLCGATSGVVYAVSVRAAVRRLPRY